MLRKDCCEVRSRGRQLLAALRVVWIRLRVLPSLELGPESPPITLLEKRILLRKDGCEVRLQGPQPVNVLRVFWVSRRIWPRIELRIQSPPIKTWWAIEIGTKHSF